MSNQCLDEINNGQRFEFGKNWQNFLTNLSDERRLEARKSLQSLLKINDLKNRSFLDVGCGSGLFSLAALELGANVCSFDFDPASVACANYLKSNYSDSCKTSWQILQGSVLDQDFLGKLGTFDIVYSWGVLHHTGHMWQAIDNFSKLVNPGGLACLAIYNDQGYTSKLWTKIKRFYCSSKAGKLFVCSIFLPYFTLRMLASSMLSQKNQFSLYKKSRGMSVVHDWLDWLGGYPFEVAKAEKIFNYFYERNYDLIHLATTNGIGNNEFVFRLQNNCS